MDEKERRIKVKLRKDGTPRKSGSGRTKGAVSLISVPLKYLTEKFSPDDLIVCGRVFVEKAGLSANSAAAITSPLTEEQKAGIQIIEL